jgi:hypothetical protein
MPQATKALTAGQFLLTTLVVKVAIVAVLSTMLVRFPWFRRILLTEKRDWPERLIFAASLGLPLTAGVVAPLTGRSGVVRTVRVADAPIGRNSSSGHPVERKSAGLG